MHLIIIGFNFVELPYVQSKKTYIVCIQFISVLSLSSFRMIQSLYTIVKKYDTYTINFIIVNTIQYVQSKLSPVIKPQKGLDGNSCQPIRA